MYPRVKVREEDEEEQEHISRQEERSSILLRVFESVTLQDHSSSGNKHLNDSLPSYARIPKSYAPKSPMPSVSVAKEKSNKGTDDDGKHNIKAGLVLRPRAVLSSPDNDGMIGNQNNQLPRERLPVSKMHNSSPNTPSQGKAGLRNVKVETTVKTRRVSKETEDKSHLKVRRTPESTVPRQKASSLRKEKTNSVGI